MEAYCHFLEDKLQWGAASHKLSIFLLRQYWKFSTEIEIFIKNLKTWNFLQCSINNPVQCCLEKANLMINFCSWWKDFLSGAALCAPLDIFSLKCNCESEVNSRKLAVLKNGISWKINSYQKVKLHWKSRGP